MKLTVSMIDGTSVYINPLELTKDDVHDFKNMLLEMKDLAGIKITNSQNEIFYFNPAYIKYITIHEE